MAHSDVGVGDVSEILASIVLVCEGLMALVKGLPMSHVQSGHDHIVAKGQLGGSGLQGGVEGGIKGPLHRSQKVLLDIGESLERDGHESQGVKLVGNDLVCLFKDAVGLWIGGTCNARGDAVGL